MMEFIIHYVHCFDLIFPERAYREEHLYHILTESDLFTPVYEGYVFSGWFYDENLKHQARVGDLITDQILNLYPKWTDNRDYFVYGIDGRKNLIERDLDRSSATYNTVGMSDPINGSLYKVRAFNCYIEGKNLSLRDTMKDSIQNLEKLKTMTNVSRVGM